MRFLGLSAVAIVCVAVGCATSQNERREQARCGAIEMYPSGVTLERPYRVLGPVSADDELTLRDRACRIGAQAIVEFRREAPSVSAMTGTGEPPSTVSGSAVAYTDGPDAGQ